MKVKELLEDDNWLDIAKDKLSPLVNLLHMAQDAMNDYRAFIKKNINRYGSQKLIDCLKNISKSGAHN